MLLAAVLAVLGAGTNAGSSVLQRKANREEPDEFSLSWRLLRDVIRKPAWLLGFGGVAAGFLIQAAALHYGAISVVQPILVIELPATVLLASVVFHRPVRRQEQIGVAVITVGLGVMLGCLAPSGGSPAGVSGLGWGLGAGASLAAVAVLVGAGRRAPGARRAALLGAATGSCFGLTAAFMTAMSRGLSHGVLPVLELWQTYAMVAAGCLALFLLQGALHAGPLVASQPGITLSDPVVSILWGALLFSERFRSGPWLLGACGGAAMVGWGAFVLSRSDLLHSDVAESRQAAG